MGKLLLDTFFTIFDQTEFHYLQTVVDRVKIMIQIFILKELLYILGKIKVMRIISKTLSNIVMMKGKKRKRRRGQSISFGNV